MKWYISGPIKGHELTYRESFAAAEAHIKDLWYEKEVVNPVALGDLLENRLGRTPTYEEYMIEDISALVRCDGIYMLEGWEHSSGARCEHLIAVMCGMAIGYAR